MALFAKGTWFYGIRLLKCPRCHTGDLFPTPTFSFKKPFKMHEKCTHCEQPYVLEVGFYYGAMFISYIFTAFSIFFFFGIFKFVFGMRILLSYILSNFILISVFVWYFRVSRALWLSFFVKYGKEQTKKT
jgi:Protein of unknown function (DUF983)